MNAQVITLRLRPNELAALDEIRNSEYRGELTRTEMIRFLILACHAKNKHQPVPKGWQYSSDARRGPGWAWTPYNAHTAAVKHNAPELAPVPDQA